MFLSTRKSQRGFSLVELMVVVAIIGVLASIAVPSINKYLAKARQSEAKTNLSSIYTSEKAFYAEYTAYHTGFQAVGFSPEGQLRYKVGFGAAGVVAGPSNGYNNAPASLDINTATYCGTGTTIKNGCSMLFGADGLANTLALDPIHTTTATTFIAGAAAVVHSSVPTGDYWTIDNNKVITNTKMGIP